MLVGFDIADSSFYEEGEQEGSGSEEEENEVEVFQALFNGVGTGIGRHSHS